MLSVVLRKELLCSNENLFIAINEPTTFCQIQGSQSQVNLQKCSLNVLSSVGFILNAAFIAYSGFWLLYVFHLFLRIVDPTKYCIISKPQHAGKIHVIEVITVLFLAFLVPIINVSALDGYNIGEYPALQCYGTVELFFHALMLPVIIISVIGVSLILITFLYIHRVSSYNIYFRYTKSNHSLCVLHLPHCHTSIC